MQLSEIPDVSRLGRRELIELLAILEDLENRRHALSINRLYPDTGPCRRELYPKHLEFFRAGATYRERCMMAANRTGKTTAGGYELALHLTGKYPPWWEGKRFAGPITAWASGKTNETTRDIVQRKLLGEVSWTAGHKSVSGTGLIPIEDIDMGSVTWKAGVYGLVDTVRVRHVSGKMSELGLKSYEQGRGSFEGTERHVIWFDEEPPMDVYSEALMRTATTDGIVMVTFTPLEGLSDVVLSFLPELRPLAADGDAGG